MRAGSSSFRMPTTGPLCRRVRHGVNQADTPHQRDQLLDPGRDACNGAIVRETWVARILHDTKVAILRAGCPAGFWHVISVYDFPARTTLACRALARGCFPGRVAKFAPGWGIRFSGKQRLKHLRGRAGDTFDAGRRDSAPGGAEPIDRARTNESNRLTGQYMGRTMHAMAVMVEMLTNAKSTVPVCRSACVLSTLLSMSEKACRRGKAFKSLCSKHQCCSTACSHRRKCAVLPAYMACTILRRGIFRGGTDST